MSPKKKTKKKTKVDIILENQNIKEWYDNFTYNNSESTAIVYLRRISSMLKGMKETPESILKLDKDTLYKKMFAYAKREKKRNMTPSYIISEFKSIYSYLSHMDVDFRRIPNPKNAKSTPTIQNEEIPSKEELSNLIQTASPRDKVSICLMAFSGIRPGVIGNAHGEDGLKMGDINEWTIKDNEIILDAPIMITVRSELSKTSNRYITFMCEEGCHHIKNYIDGRIRDGETITKESPMVRGVFKHKIDHIGTNAVRNGIRFSMRKAGITKRPYVLRRYFATKLQEAEYHRLIIHSQSQFMMGHQGDMMSTYTQNKGLTKVQMDDMREAYSNCQKYLQTDVTRIEIEKTQERMETIETKSKTMEEILFDRISKLEDEKNGLKEIIEQLRKDNNKTIKWLLEYKDQQDHLSKN